MKRSISFLLAVSLVVTSAGCATMKNTKIPQEYSDLGICPACKKVVAAEDLSDSEIAVCPECSSEFLVKDAKYKFRAKCVDMRNQRTAISVFTVALLAASVAGAIYGIPIPAPPILENTFKPYKLPDMIACRRASQPLLEAPEERSEVPGLNPYGRTDPNAPIMLNERYGFYESPYSVIIVDKYYGEDDALEEYVSYGLSLGKLKGERYDPEFIGGVSVPAMPQDIRGAAR